MNGIHTQNADNGFTDNERTTTERFYSIAGLCIKITFVGNKNDENDLLPSFRVFRTDTPASEILFSLTVNDNLRPISKKYRERVGTFDTGNGDTIVDSVNGNDYQFIIKDVKRRNCCMLQSNGDFSVCSCALNGDKPMRAFGLNNAIMMAFAFSGSFVNTLLMHASAIRQGKWGYAFTAKSGTGKSTHTSLWIENIPGCDLINDDNPVIRIINGEAYIYGSPWSGKTPCYRNIKTRLGAIIKIERASENRIAKLTPTMAFSQILPSCSTMKWDKKVFRNTCDTVIKLIELSTSNYTLECLPNKEAAILCHSTIKK